MVLRWPVPLGTVLVAAPICMGLVALGVAFAWHKHVFALPTSAYSTVTWAFDATVALVFAGAGIYLLVTLAHSLRSRRLIIERKMLMAQAGGTEQRYNILSMRMAPGNGDSTPSSEVTFRVEDDTGEVIELTGQLPSDALERRKKKECLEAMIG